MKSLLILPFLTFCKIIPVKCTDESSQGNYLSSAYEGIAYAMNAGADIISMSFGSATNSAIGFTGQNVLNTANA